MNEEVMIPKSYHDKVCEEIIRFKDKQFYDAVHLLDDGTLEITVGDYTKVKRVLVEDCNNFGNLFYENDTDRPQGWIPCSERLPKINQNVLLSTTNGTVFVGHRDKPDLIWQVTESDGRKHWVYDPEAYTDDVDALPKGEDCGFSTNTDYADGFTSVTSLNYDDRFIGINAWMPLPEPWKGADDE